MIIHKSKFTINNSQCGGGKKGELYWVKMESLHFFVENRIIAICCSSCAKFLSFLATLALPPISQFIVTANCFIISFLLFGQIFLQLIEIYLAFWTNIFCKLDKWQISSLQFGQIMFIIDRNSFCNLNKCILQIGKIYFLQFGKIMFTIERNWFCKFIATSNSFIISFQLARSPRKPSKCPQFFFGNLIALMRYIHEKCK